MVFLENKINIHLTILLYAVLLLISSCAYQEKSFEESDNDEKLRKASIIAQKIVEEQIGTCDFDGFDYVGEETMVKNRFKVIQKFESYGLEYAYRIYIQYKGGDWEDINNWSYGQLTIEDVLTGEQQFFHGTMKKEELQTFTRKISGIDCKLETKGTGAVRVYTESKLSEEQIKSVISNICKEYDTMYFATNSNDVEYCSWFNNKIYDHDANQIKTYTP
ncbi:hypothetical protein C7Y71_003160 [Pseudoprevotella muciniphila]|uniref:Lipoprotein n=1 Tax=Pseudoprevotella muciniphila TaxID=2133944 RepID=A0A5P8E590_9BACT|nr:hypothetical protein [Pseudoprevotella muciniphila]QFQ12098.1 hypothetical protein C7Y71_003160 [Pseudoprevotella muciniphila]